MEDYRLENFMGGKRLRLKDFDDYGIFLNGTADGFVYENENHIGVTSVSAVVRGKARVSDLDDKEIEILLVYVGREAKVVHVDLQKAIQLRDLEKRLLYEGRITRGVA